jgi:hypothetical protein
LDTLPKDDFNAAVLKQKQQYEASLKSARRIKEELEKKGVQGIHISEKKNKLPWQAAEEMLPALKEARNPMSSVSRDSWSEFNVHVAFLNTRHGSYLEHIRCGDRVSSL